MRQEYVIHHLLGLHVGPSKQIARRAAEFECDVYLEKNGKQANAKKLIEVLTLGVKKNDTVALITEGPGSAEAQQAIGELLRQPEAANKNL
jgi:phosphocarrier protein